MNEKIEALKLMLDLSKEMYAIRAIRKEQHYLTMEKIYKDLKLVMDESQKEN